MPILIVLLCILILQQECTPSAQLWGAMALPAIEAAAMPSGGDGDRSPLCSHGTSPCFVGTTWSALLWCEDGRTG